MLNVRQALVHIARPAGIDGAAFSSNLLEDVRPNVGYFTCSIGTDKRDSQISPGMHETYSHMASVLMQCMQVGSRYVLLHIYPTCGVFQI